MRNTFLLQNRSSYRTGSRQRIKSSYLFVMTDTTHLKVCQNLRIVSLALLMAIGPTTQEHNENIKLSLDKHDLTGGLLLGCSTMGGNTST